MSLRRNFNSHIFLRNWFWIDFMSLHSFKSFRKYLEDTTQSYLTCIQHSPFCSIDWKKKKKTHKWRAVSFHFFFPKDLMTVVQETGELLQNSVCCRVRRPVKGHVQSSTHLGRLLVRRNRYLNQWFYYCSEFGKIEESRFVNNFSWNVSSYLWATNTCFPRASLSLSWIPFKVS